MNYFQLPHSNDNAESGVKSYDTITAELYCDVLQMPHTCKNNLEMAKSNATKNSINAGSTADAAYQQIVAYGYLLGYLLPKKKDRVEVQKERINFMKEKKKFCWVDIERLFQSAQSWDEIIDHRMVNIDWDAENGSIGER